MEARGGILVEEKEGTYRDQEASSDNGGREVGTGSRPTGGNRNTYGANFVGEAVTQPALALPRPLFLMAVAPALSHI
jgi:hypothetical protein